MSEQENAVVANGKQVVHNSAPVQTRKAVEPLATQVKASAPSDPFALDKEVLAHQLEGVMFHSDMVLLYTLLDCKKMCEVHFKQLVLEMKAHTCTAKDMIKRYGRIIEAKPAERIIVYNSDVAPSSEEEKEKLKEKAFNAWHEWEVETQKLYENMVMAQPHVDMWKKLHKDVTMELKHLSHMKMR